MKKFNIKVADETWIACALLHYENPEEEAFTVGQIVEKVQKENIYGQLRPGIRVHVSHGREGLPETCQKSSRFSSCVPIYREV